MQEWIPSVTNYFIVMEILSLIQKKYRQRDTGLEQVPVLHHLPAYELLQCPSWIFLFLLLYKNIYIQEKWEDDPHVREHMLTPRRLEMHYKSNLS